MRKPEELGLTRGEWSLILDANNGHLVMRDVMGNPMMSARWELWPNVVDHIRLNRADLHHGVHADVLTSKLEALTDEDWEVVGAVVEGFWALSDDCNTSRIPGDKEDDQ